MKWLSPTVRLRYRKSGAPHSLSGDIQLNTISDIDKGGKYSMPVSGIMNGWAEAGRRPGAGCAQQRRRGCLHFSRCPAPCHMDFSPVSAWRSKSRTLYTLVRLPTQAKDVRSLLSAFGAELNGTFYFACTGRHGNVLSLDVTYTPPKPAAPASRSPPPAAGGNTTTRSPANASKAAAASAPGYMQAGSAAAAGQPPRGAAAAGRPSRPSASAVDLCSEDDEPLIYRVHARHARAAKRPAPTPAAAAGSPAKQARLTGSSAHKAAGQPAPTTPAGAGEQPHACTGLGMSACVVLVEVWHYRTVLYIYARQCIISPALDPTSICRYASCPPLRRRRC